MSTPPGWLPFEVADTGLVRRVLLPPVKIDRSIGEYLFYPGYPKKERKAHHQGTVILWLVINPDGLPRDIRISRSLSPEFDEAAVDAVKRWRFSPAT